jgi:hypothetical protein
MVEFETVAAEHIPFGSRNFIEIARKKARDGERENEFISISRGFFGQDGNKRFKQNVTVPLDANVIDFISKKIKEI